MNAKVEQYIGRGEQQGDMRALQLEHATQAMAAIGATAHYDWRLARYDVQCSMAHVTMLRRQHIISDEVAQQLLDGLDALRAQIDAGLFRAASDAEDIHTAIEQQLDATLGPITGNLSIARARNDLAVTALKLWLRDQLDALLEQLHTVVEALCDQAQRHAWTVMPGFSHLQSAQPITFGHLCLAYGESLFRDVERLKFARDGLRECPLGSAALAGTRFSIDRFYVAEQLGFERPTANSIDSVGERGFALDFLAAAASLALDLSRLASEIVFWASQPVGFIRLPDALVTSSAAMPHKRNPDAAELVRAKSGRVLGHLHALQTVVKGLPLSYFRDLQEDKEPLFDTADSLRLMLDATLAIVRLMEPQTDAMAQAASNGFTTSSDLADWLVQKRGVPFREAHHIVGKLVKLAQQHHCTLAALPETARAEIDSRIAGTDWPTISPAESVLSRNSFGGTAPTCVGRAAGQLSSRIAASRVLYCAAIAPDSGASANIGSGATFQRAEVSSSSI
ncbi:argininosuccinate lyase [Paraburkholderia tropica]|uniref:argininosuccinate lyase n=1 Tax=Paraburkholderia tropica TaxID=92647 RepID=UPI0032B3FED0